MNTKFIGICSFASIAIALLMAQPNAGELASVSSRTVDTSSNPRFAPIDMADFNDGALAFSLLTPLPSRQQLPVADMVDIAADNALQQKKRIVPDKAPPADQNQKGSSESDSSATQLEPNITAPSFSSVEYLASNLTNRHTTQTFSAAGSAPLSFSRLLQTDGFNNTKNWQDLGFDEHLYAVDAHVEPFVVMLDPGHGGSDPGAIGHNGLLEKDLTLDIARRVRLFLTEFKHINVQLTRNHDHGLSRRSRVSAIKRSDADMVISLHFNHLPQSEVNLVESYYAGPENIQDSLSVQSQRRIAKALRTGKSANSVDFGFTAGSKRLAHTLQQRVFSEVSMDNEEVHDAGVKQETLFVLTRSFTPGVLLEISCLSHPAEADKLAVEAYRDRLAAALADGIRHYHDSLQSNPLETKHPVGV